MIWLYKAASSDFQKNITVLERRFDRSNIAIWTVLKVLINSSWHSLFNFSFSEVILQSYPSKNTESIKFDNPRQGKFKSEACEFYNSKNSNSNLPMTSTMVEPISPDGRGQRLWKKISAIGRCYIWIRIIPCSYSNDKIHDLERQPVKSLR
jgi:hypothetical protein